MGRRLTQFFWLAALVALASGAEAQDGAGVTCSQFDVVWSIDSGVLVLRLETDLPPGTAIMASVDRDYRESSEPDETFCFGYDGCPAKSTVQAWKTPVKVSLDPQAWLQRFLARQLELRRSGLFGKVTEVSDNLSIRFVVPINQDDPRFGKRNSNLRGARVIEKDGLRLVEWEKDVPHPVVPPLGGLTTEPDPKIAKRCTVLEEEDVSVPAGVRIRYRVVLEPTITKADFRSFVENFIRRRLVENWDIDVIAIFAYTSRGAYQAGGGIPDLGSATWGPSAPSVAVEPPVGRANVKTSFKLVVEDRGSGWELQEARRAEAAGEKRPEGVPTEEEIRVHEIAMKEMWARPDDSENQILRDVAKRFGKTAEEVERIVKKVEVWKLKQRFDR